MSGRYWLAEHVGDYGRPGGDITARGTYRIFPEEQEPEPPYAAVGIYDSREAAQAAKLDFEDRAFVRAKAVKS